MRSRWRRRSPKQQILERYLNIAYFGDGAYGVGTAAQHYFGVPVQKLTLPQSALLAGLVQSPEAYDPTVHPETARARRDTVLAQMLQYHFISAGGLRHGGRDAARADVHEQGNGCEASRYPYFCDYVSTSSRPRRRSASSPPARNELPRARRPDHPHDAAAAGAAGRGHGDAQLRASRTSRPASPAPRRWCEPGTGKVLALSVSRRTAQDPKKRQNDIDYAVDHAYGRRRVPASATGSTFKLFVLAAALKEGFPLSTTIYAPQHLHRQRLHRLRGNGAGSWDVHNAGDSEARPLQPRQRHVVLRQHVLRAARAAGRVVPAGQAGRGDGRASRQRRRASTQYPSFALGANDAGFSALDTAGAYATMAAHGLYCSPIAITRVTDRDRQELSGPRARTATRSSTPASPTPSPAILHGVLTQAAARPPRAWASPAAQPPRRRVRRRTTARRTSPASCRRWPRRSGSATRKRSDDTSADGLTIGGRHYGEVFGATIAGPIWRDTMRPLSRACRSSRSPPPDPKYVQRRDKAGAGRQRPAAVRCDRRAEGTGFPQCRRVRTSVLDSLFPDGTVAYTSPPGGGWCTSRRHHHRSTSATARRPSPRRRRHRRRRVSSRSPRRARHRRRRLAARVRPSRTGHDTADRRQPAELAAYLRGDPATLGAAGYLRLHDLHDLTHRLRAARPGLRDRRADERRRARRRPSCAGR